LWLLVAVQVAIPASYYLGGGDPDDERFAWRMFSGVRLKRCQVSAFGLDDAGSEFELRLAGALHGSWLHALERGRQRVIERYLVTHCQSGVRSVKLERRCSDVRHGSVPAERYVYDCRSGSFMEEAP
jgi:hypothetical protein